MSLYNTLDSSVLTRPGQYYLTDINLISYRSGTDDSEPDKIGIDSLVAEVNIYESIYNKTLSGNLFVVDTQNIVGKLPLTGNERLGFKLYTPSSPFGYDFSEKSGHPMYIYKITNRVATGPRSQAYIIHFCSKEMIDNETASVASAMNTSYDLMVADITKNPYYLGSNKNFYYEPAIGLNKFVFGRNKPFDCIDKLSKNTISSKFHNAGYYFYETNRGFNYKSLESMLAVESNTARPAAARFRPKPANISDGRGEKDIRNEMQIAIDYKVSDQFDQLKNLRNGVYANKLITHDQFYKTITEQNFNYEDEYGKMFHTETDRTGSKETEKGILPKYVRNGKSLSEYPDGTIYVHSNTQNIYGSNIETPDPHNILQRRLSQRSAFATFKLTLTVNGFTGIQAGDIITYEHPSYESKVAGEQNDNDIYLSGRYLVTTVRHQINQANKKHLMVLECHKDSVRRPYPQEINDTFIGREKIEEGIIDIYEFDKILYGGLSTSFK